MGSRLNSCLLGIARLRHSEALRSKKFSDYIGVNGEAAIFPLKCDTCALIGTSGHLRKSTSGRDIDKSYSCIFRLGFSPTRGYEDQVGSRTTARIVDSFRFYPFLKKPLKLVTGPFPSDFWFLFDPPAATSLFSLCPLLKDLRKTPVSQNFLWFSRAVERSVLNSLDSKRLKNGMNRISSLLFATRVIEDAGCESLTVYGVPDAQICKRNLNISIPSLYWDENSFHLCDYGVDASVKSTNSKASVSIVPSIAERRLLPKWLEQHFYASDFKFPSWENWTSP
ncbi:Alpha-N-acetylgalactosaminide like protein [Argiope bruennichi]|uniref:Alpha-N-acetylgalactosaminide like protein n=1 Tax=Argiope bruennichi TaxID=94029 RepID=A0A8T0E928_ARGBR|nr:Alpha-N-acetylgalactosaminide like protein [Argiope bruennichi]